MTDHETPRLPFITAKEFGDREALKDVLATLAESWETEAHRKLILRSLRENEQGWTLQRCAADLRLAAGIPNPDAPRAVEDRRQKAYCSVRCQQRITKRKQRDRKTPLCDPSRAIHVTPHTPESGCGARAMSPVTASRTDAE